MSLFFPSLLLPLPEPTRTKHLPHATHHASCWTCRDDQGTVMKHASLITPFWEDFLPLPTATWTSLHPDTAVLCLFCRQPSPTLPSPARAVQGAASVTLCICPDPIQFLLHTGGRASSHQITGLPCLKLSAGLSLHLGQKPHL